MNAIQIEDNKRTIIKKHLVVADVDGTITNPDFETLNPRVKKVFDKLTADGHFVCLSTGRNFRRAMNMYRQAGLKTYLSAYNGAFVVNPTREGSVPMVFVISNAVIKSVIREHDIRSNLLSAAIDMDNLQILCTNPEDTHFKTITLPDNEDNYIKTDITHLLDVLGERDAVQITLEFPKTTSVINKVIAILRRYRHSIAFYPEKKRRAEKPGDQVLIPDNSKVLFRLRSRYTNKARSAEIMCGYHNIPLGRALAFGNELNDVDIMRVVGRGIVTADSDIYLKTLAYDILSDEDGQLNSSGVAGYLERFFGYGDTGIKNKNNNKRNKREAREG